MNVATENLNNKSKNLLPVIDGMYSLLNGLDSSETNKSVSIDFRDELNMLEGRPSMFKITNNEIVLYINTIVYVTDVRKLEVGRVINTIKLTVTANLRNK